MIRLEGLIGDDFDFFRFARVGDDLDFFSCS